MILPFLSALTPLHEINYKPFKTMRIYLTALIPLFLVTFCQSASTTKETAVPPPPPNPAGEIPAYQMKPDTIEIRGKFLTGCTVPGSIKVALHNVDNTFWKDAPVNPKTGEFTFKHYLTEPRRAAVRTLYGVKYDFFTTTSEKIYQLEINCATKTEVIEIKGSPENDAYRPYAVANKKFQETLDSLGKRDLSHPDTFAMLRKTVADYQKTIADIAAAHPNTFTGKVFCAADKLPDGSWNSLESLRKNILNNPAFANPQFYNDFAPQRILLSYVAIRDRHGDPNEPIETLMSIGLRNREAAKRLQEIVSNIFYRMHQEDLIIAYINWAERNPDKMYNQSIKQRLQNLKKVVAGNQFYDFELKDTNGKPRKLSETVSSSKLTLLIFYSPTCGHCKEKVPEMIPVWEKYKNKGLKIYAAGHDAKDEEWKKFITNNASPEWVHVFQPENEPKASDLYIAETPSFILIDSEGKIVSRIGDLDFVKKEIEKRLQ